MRTKIGLCLGFLFAGFGSATAQEMPELHLPFPGGETWGITTGYNGSPTHRGRDYYAIDWNLADNDDCGHLAISVASGSVVTANIDGVGGGYGNYVDVDLGAGYVARVSHLSRVDVIVGQNVITGDTLGLVGSTGQSSGCHIHFVLYRNGNSVLPEPMSGYTGFVEFGSYTSDNYGVTLLTAKFCNGGLDNGCSPNYEVTCNPVSGTPTASDPSGTTPYFAPGEDIILNAKFGNVYGNSVRLRAYVTRNGQPFSRYCMSATDIDCLSHREGPYSFAGNPHTAFVLPVVQGATLLNGNTTTYRFYACVDSIGTMTEEACKANPGLNMAAAVVPRGQIFRTVIPSSPTNRGDSACTTGGLRPAGYRADAGTTNNTTNPGPCGIVNATSGDLYLCREGEGACNADTECQSGLVCSSHICQSQTTSSGGGTTGGSSPPPISSELPTVKARYVSHLFTNGDNTMIPPALGFSVPTYGVNEDAILRLTLNIGGEGLALVYVERDGVNFLNFTKTQTPMASDGNIVVNVVLKATTGMNENETHFRYLVCHDQANNRQRTETECKIDADFVGEIVVVQPGDLITSGERCGVVPNGDYNYCSRLCPCALGQGNCQDNSECQEGLVCLSQLDDYGINPKAQVCQAKGPEIPANAPATCTFRTYPGRNNPYICNGGLQNSCLENGLSCNIANRVKPALGTGKPTILAGEDIIWLAAYGQASGACNFRSYFYKDGEPFKKMCQNERDTNCFSQAETFGVFMTPTNGYVIPTIQGATLGKTNRTIYKVNVCAECATCRNKSRQECAKRPDFAMEVVVVPNTNVKRTFTPSAPENRGNPNCVLPPQGFICKDYCADKNLSAGECKDGWMCDCNGQCASQTNCTAEHTCGKLGTEKKCKDYRFRAGECRGGWQCDCDGQYVVQVGCKKSHLCNKPCEYLCRDYRLNPGQCMRGGMECDCNGLCMTQTNCKQNNLCGQACTYYCFDSRYNPGQCKRGGWECGCDGLCLNQTGCTASLTCPAN